jgi:hypothetical protein
MGNAADSCTPRSLLFCKQDEEFCTWEILIWLEMTLNETLATSLKREVGRLEWERLALTD